jgi:hypothetical protein
VWKLEPIEPRGVKETRAFGSQPMLKSFFSVFVHWKFKGNSYRHACDSFKLGGIENSMGWRERERERSVGYSRIEG